MGTMNRSEWTDDDGSGMVGTPINNDELQKIYNNVELEVRSPNKPAITTRSIIDNLIAGVPFDFGGSSDAWTDRNSYATGAGYDPDTVIAPASRIWKVDSALLTGVFRLEALLRTTDAGYSAKLGLFNMTDAPNVALVEISTALVAGALLRSDQIVFAAPGVEKEYAVKLMTTAPTGEASASGWGYRVYRGD